MAHCAQPPKARVRSSWGLRQCSSHHSNNCYVRTLTGLRHGHQISLASGEDGAKLSQVSVYIVLMCLKGSLSLFFEHHRQLHMLSRTKSKAKQKLIPASHCSACLCFLAQV